jgi:hypothetical protein
MSMSVTVSPAASQIFAALASPPPSLSRLQLFYEWTGLARGLTVQEWETLRGLPPYSVYPCARRSRAKGRSNEVGYGMYAPEHLEAWEAEELRQIRCLIGLGVTYRETGLVMGMREVLVWRRIHGRRR